MTTLLTPRCLRAILAALAAALLAAGCGEPAAPAREVQVDEEAALRAAVQAQPQSPRPRLALVAYLASRQRRCEALEAARAAFAAFPDSGPARQSLALALADMERFAEAAALLRPLAPVNPEARLQWGRYLLRSGDLAGAAEAVRPLAQSGAFALEAGQLCLDALRFEEAVRFFQRSAREHRHDPDLQAHLGLALLLAGRAREALGPLQAAVGGAPERAALHSYLAAAQRLTGEAGGAEKSLREALRLEPRSALNRYELGLALLAQRKASAAEKELREAAALQPQIPEIQRDLARACRMRGRAADAAAAQARWLRLVGDGPAAAAVLEPVVAVKQAETALALELAEAYYDAWQTPRTLTLLGKLHSGHPHNPDVLAALFRARKAAHRHREALDALEELIRRAPDDLALLDQKAELLQQLGRYPELELLLEDLARREPGSAVRQYRLGLALAQWSARPDRTLAARQAFESAIRFDPEHAESYYRVGLIQQAEQQIEASAASFRRCLDLAPRSLDAMKGLAGSYALQGDRAREREWLNAYRVLKKVRDEEEHLKMAATLRRPTPAENRALGFFHLRHVRYEQAVAQLESAEHGGGLSPAERRTLSALYGHLRRFQRMSEARAGA